MRLSAEEGKFLVRLARESILAKMKGQAIKVPEVSEKLREKRGVFVSLHKDGELRGCIGYPYPYLPLVEATIQAALAAAFEDPRFPPVKMQEMEHTTVEVSVLSEPELIVVKEPKDYPKAVEVGKHGLIVEGVGTSGLLLPQVAIEFGWDAEEFLSQTCMKAGLPPDMWLTKEVRVSRFTAQIFSEVKPGGDVVERKP